ncbi:MAG: hypothetical protein IJF36_00860 [Oscillibacter sp.]|nr:hypothetical protein [Oscillibacter sp.]
MAFWKKSDDPWDRKPEKRQEATWWEQDAPPVAESDPPPAEEKEEGLGASIRKFFAGDDTPVSPQLCPWCGREMEWGRITGGRDGVLWKNWRQKGLLDIVKPDGWKELDMLDVRPKTVWLCSDCGKMVLDAPKYGYSEGQPKVDMEAYTGGGGFTPDPKAYENYQSQWGTKEEE